MPWNGGEESATAPEPIGENRYRATVVPSLGEDQHRRFKGCLQDGTIDKVRGSVVRMVGVNLADDDNDRREEADY